MCTATGWWIGLKESHNYFDGRMGRPRRKSGSRPVVRCIFQCLMLELFPDIIKWDDQPHKIFSILFRHKKSRDWSLEDLNFFKKLDSLSDSKRVKYDKEKDPEQSCKRRCKANLRKLKKDGILEYIKTKKIDKCTKFIYYKFKEIPCDSNVVENVKPLEDNMVHSQIKRKKNNFSLLQEKQDDLNELMKLTQVDEESNQHLMNDNVFGIGNNNQLNEEILNSIADCRYEINEEIEISSLPAKDRDAMGNISPTSEINYDGMKFFLISTDEPIKEIVLVPESNDCYTEDLECTHSMFENDQDKYFSELTTNANHNFILGDLDTLPSSEGSVEIDNLLTEMSDGGGNEPTLPLLSSGVYSVYNDIELEALAESLYEV